jgi:threonine dehydrogenase-like Zn-dependent dehydrogenase
MTHEEFYNTLITRNRLVIDDKTQMKLKNGRFLIAGCGSIGSAIVEPLVRIGAENLVLAEPDPFELANLNRQQARIQDVGVNKAVAVRDQAQEISPFAKFKIYDNGLTNENIDEALNGVSIVFDGVDVTGIVPLEIKYKMHKAAKAKGIPIISGYDVAGLQMLVVYRYDIPGTKIMLGKIVESDFKKGMRPMDFLFKVVPLRNVPLEIFPAVRKMLANENIGFPQVVYTAKSYGNMALAAAIEVLNGRPTRNYVVYDHNAAVRPWMERAKIEIRRWFELSNLLVAYFRSRSAK